MNLLVWIPLVLLFLALPIFVVSEQIRTHSGSDCPVCGHPVTEAPHPCPSCRTPHHAECWSYFGGCSLYGCPAKAA